MAMGTVMVNEAYTGIFQNLLNTIAADALAPCVARTSAAMVLSWDVHVTIGSLSH